MYSSLNLLALLDVEESSFNRHEMTLREASMEAMHVLADTPLPSLPCIVKPQTHGKGGAKPRLAVRLVRKRRQKARRAGVAQPEEQLAEKEAPAEVILPADVGRSAKGRRNIQKLFCWAVAQDRLAFAQNALFDEEDRCRVHQFKGMSVATMAKRCVEFLEVDLVRIRCRQRYSQRVFEIFKAIKRELQGRDGADPSRAAFLQLLKKINLSTDSGHTV